MEIVVGTLAALLLILGIWQLVELYNDGFFD